MDSRLELITNPGRVSRARRTARLLMVTAAFIDVPAVSRARAASREEQLFRAEQLTAMLRDFPIGLLILDWDLAPIWFNEEAALACAVWNHGERHAAAVNPKLDFELPVELAEVCAGLRLHRELEDLKGMLLTLAALARITAVAGRQERAARIVAGVLHLYTKAGNRLDPAEKADRDVLETLIQPDRSAPRLPLGLRVVVEFLAK